MPFLDEKSLRLLIVVAVLAGVLTIGYAILAAWHRRVHEEEPPTDADLLDQFRAAHEEGELDAEEFRRVRDVLARRAPEADPPRRPVPPRRPRDGLLPGVANESETRPQSDGGEEGPDDHG